MSSRAEKIVCRASRRDSISVDFWDMSFSTATGDYTNNPGSAGLAQTTWHTMGKWHNITGRVTPPQNSLRLRVYAKAGYYAPAQ